MTLNEVFLLLEQNLKVQVSFSCRVADNDYRNSHEFNQMQCRRFSKDVSWDSLRISVRSFIETCECYVTFFQT